jgi:hypothetical protein
VGQKYEYVFGMDSKHFFSVTNPLATGEMSVVTRTKKGNSSLPRILKNFSLSCKSIATGQQRLFTIPLTTCKQRNLAWISEHFSLGYNFTCNWTIKSQLRPHLQLGRRKIQD